MDLIEYIGNMEPGTLVFLLLFIPAVSFLIWLYTPKGKKWLHEN